MLKALRYKKILWPINLILFNISRLSLFRRKNLWVFGAVRGTKYDDNAKYLFEYIKTFHSDEFRCLWLAQDKNVVALLREQGYESYKSDSKEGYKIKLKAGVAFYKKGLEDFGYLPMLGGAKIVCLWHGFSFKRLYNYNYKGVKAVLKYIADSLFNWVYRDYSMVTSEYVKSQFLAEFSIKNPDTIFITGQPRNDALFRKVDMNNILTTSVIEKCQNKKIILYMPTYRAKGQGKRLDAIIKELVEDEQLNLFLERTNYVFLIKLHPLTPPINVRENDNFIVLEYTDVKANHELLSLGDILVTDYSAVIVDYALLNRPIIFYIPDKDEYIKYSGTLEEDFDKVSSLCKANSPQELLPLIKSPQMDVVKSINDIFSDVSTEGTCYCENVYEIVRNEVL